METTTCYFCKNMYFKGIEWDCRLKHKTGKACSQYDEDTDRKEARDYCISVLKRIATEKFTIS